MHQPIAGEAYERVLQDSDSSSRQKTSQARKTNSILLLAKPMASAAIILLAMRGIRWETLMVGFAAIKPTWLVLAITSVVSGMSLKLWRWAILIKNYPIKTSHNRLFNSYFIGQAANILLPFRDGEVIRIGYFTGQVHILPQVAMTTC